MSAPQPDATFDELASVIDELHAMETRQRVLINRRALLVHELLSAGLSLAEVAARCNVHRSRVHQWGRR